MKATITSLGGRAPPGRKTPTLSAGFRSLASTRRFRVRAASGAGVHQSSAPDAPRHHAPPGGPIGEAIRPGSPTSRRWIESRPTETDARGGVEDHPDCALTQLRGVLAGSSHGLHPLSEWALRQTRYDSVHARKLLVNHFHDIADWREALVEHRGPWQRGDSLQKRFCGSA